MKKAYVKPVVESESVFETLALACTLLTDADEQCNGDFGGTNLNSK